jgi:phage tail sheath protein FI
MPVNPTYPGLYIEELPSSAHTITAAPTSITVLIGFTHPFQGEVASRGTWGTPIRIFNMTDYERYFGGVYRNAVIGRCDVGYAADQFFRNGGSDAYVIGIQPRYFNPAGTDGDIAGATGSIAGLAFTATELTDASKRITITIRNVRASSSTSGNDLADLMIAYGLQVERYPAVRLRSGPRSNYTDPTLGTYDKDFIDNRLAESQLVKVAPRVGTTYPATYAITGLQASVDLIDMPGPGFAADMFKAEPFVKVFDTDGPLDKVEIFNLLAVPGVTDFSVWSTGLSFCERKRAMYIMDPPELTSADGMGSLPTIETVFKSGAIPNSSPNGALYFPYLKTLDPSSGDVVHLPPSGYVAGIYARTDTNRGVWKAPAGLETSLLNTTGVVDEGKMTDMRQGTLNPIGVNVLRSFPGSGTVVWGARTIVAANPSFEQWRYVPVRRMALFIEQTLLRNLGWVVFEPNDEPLWAAIRMSIDAFMLGLFHQQAFQGSTPSESFMVKCDKSTTTQEDINNGKVNIVVGFRPLKPAEFVIIKIAQLAGQVQA